MSFQELHRALVARLNEGGRGDRGWWLVTRVHLSASRLQRVASYIHDAAGERALTLTQQHYRELGAILGVRAANPRTTINRHYFLALDKPLRLLRRTHEPSWDSVVLTPEGLRLAIEPDPVAVFERILREIVFCRTPWYTTGRVAEYSEFNLHPYGVVLQILGGCGGYIDLDEFDLFASRVRSEDEIPSATAAILAFRETTAVQKAQLRNEVIARLPAGTGNDPLKPYNNWRDMARHTFSLLSLGVSAHRAGNRLYLSSELAGEGATPRRAAVPRGTARAAQPRPARPRTPLTLRLPDAEAPAALLTPPVLPQGNTGTEAELLIGKILTAAGWQVVYYGQRRGYGFDLWAKRGDDAFLIEVKSALGRVATVTLTTMEIAAARHHASNYLLIVVENVESEAPSIHVIQDPANAMQFAERATTEFTAARTVWLPLATQNLPP